MSDGIVIRAGDIPALIKAVKAQSAAIRQLADGYRLLAEEFANLESQLKEVSDEHTTD